MKKLIVCLAILFGVGLAYSAQGDLFSTGNGDKFRVDSEGGLAKVSTVTCNGTLSVAGTSNLTGVVTFGSTIANATVTDLTVTNSTTTVSKITTGIISDAQVSAMSSCTNATITNSTTTVAVVTTLRPTTVQAQGAVGIYVRSNAQLKLISPTAVGQLYWDSDNGTLYVSTGTGQYAFKKVTVGNPD